MKPKKKTVAAVVKAAEAVSKGKTPKNAASKSQSSSKSKSGGKKGSSKTKGKLKPDLITEVSKDEEQSSSPPPHTATKLSYAETARRAVLTSPKGSPVKKKASAK